MIKILWIDDFDNSMTNKKRIEFISILGNYIDNIQENLNRLGNSKDNKPTLNPVISYQLSL